MGIVIKQSFKTLIITYIGLAIGYINTLWLFPFILSKEEIGFTRLFINLCLLFATFASLGAVNIPNKFFPYFDDKEKRHNGFLFFLILLGSGGFLIFTILFFAFKNLVYSIYSVSAPLLVEYYYFFLLLAFIALYYSIFESYLIIQKKPVVPNIVKEVIIRIFFSVALLLVWFNFINFHQFVIAIILTYLTGLLLILVYTEKLKVLFLKPNLQVFKSVLFKQIFGYGLFQIVGNAINLLILNIDGVMLSAYKGLGATGIYSIAFFIATVIEIPKRSLSQSLIPFISEANKNNNIQKLKSIYKSSAINQLIIGGFIFIGIWSNVENIFNLMPNTQIYIQGKWVVFYIGLSKLFDLATGVNTEIIGTSKYYKIDLFFLGFLGITAIITNILLIPPYGIAGAALASAISVFLFNILRSLFLLIKFKIQPFSTDTVKVLIIGGIVLFINFLIPYLDNLYLDIVIRSLVILLLFGGMVFLTKASEELNIIALKIIKRINSK